MRSLRAASIGAGLLMLSAAPLLAQSSKVACKDGSKPKSGHFSCWGHGGLVAAAAKAESAKSARAEKAASKSTAKKAGGAGTRAAGSKVAKKKSAKKARAKRSA